MRPLFM